MENITSLLPMYNGDIEELKSSLDSSLVSSIYVRTGPMNSGKTSELITKCKEFELQGLPCIIIRPLVDTRSEQGKVQSATGGKKSCFTCSTLIDNEDTLNYIIKNAHVIFIDEAQFFGKDLVSFCQLMAHEKGKSVWVYGLNGDSERKKFGYISDLMPLWTDHKSLYGFCSTCKIGRRGV